MVENGGYMDEQMSFIIRREKRIYPTSIFFLFYRLFCLWFGKETVGVMKTAQYIVKNSGLKN